MRVTLFRNCLFHSVPIPFGCCHPPLFFQEPRIRQQQQTMSSREKRRRKEKKPEKSATRLKRKSPACEKRRRRSASLPSGDWCGERVSLGEHCLHNRHRASQLRCPARRLLGLIPQRRKTRFCSIRTERRVFSRHLGTRGKQIPWADPYF